MIPAGDVHPEVAVRALGFVGQRLPDVVQERRPAGQLGVPVQLGGHQPRKQRDFD